MGNNNTKTDRLDETYLRNLSEGMDTLRRSLDSFPENTRKFKLMLDSNEKKVQDVLRRSRRGSTRKKAMDILSELEDLKEKERASIRDSSLDTWAVESNSIIAADAKKYDKSRQRSRSVENLQEIRKKVDQLSSKINGTETREEATASRKHIEVLMTQLDRVQVRPKSKLEAFKDEYKNKLRRYDQKLATRESMVATDGAAMSTPNEPKQQPPPRPTSMQRDQQKHLNAQDELAFVRGQVMSLQTECEKFDGYKDTPEYDMLNQNLMKLWDKLGKITDPKLVAERDSIITLISNNLKRLNRKCASNTRDSLSKNKILSLAELFHMQYKKIAIHIKQGRAKETEQVYRILRDIHDGLEMLLDGANQNECQLVTARLTPSAKRRPVSIYVSNEQMMSTDFDTVYVQDDAQPRRLKSNQSCPNFLQQEERAHAAYAPTTAAPPSKPIERDDSVDKLLETMNHESNMLRYAVEEFNGHDEQKCNELDERLIGMIIRMEKLKGNLNAHGEQQRLAIMQRVHATCGMLKKKSRISTMPADAYVRTGKELQQLHDIDSTLAHLEILKTQINESYDWQPDNPEFKVLEDALKSALLRLDLIESGDQVVRTLKADAISEVQHAIGKLNGIMNPLNRYAGTEV